MRFTPSLGSYPYNLLILANFNLLKKSLAVSTLEHTCLLVIKQLQSYHVLVVLGIDTQVLVQFDSSDV
jgi:hypothetical protein